MKGAKHHRIVLVLLVAGKAWMHHQSFSCEKNSSKVVTADPIWIFFFLMTTTKILVVTVNVPLNTYNSDKPQSGISLQSSLFCLYFRSLSVPYAYQCCAFWGCDSYLNSNTEDSGQQDQDATGDREKGKCTSPNEEHAGPSNSVCCL